MLWIPIDFIEEPASPPRVNALPLFAGALRAGSSGTVTVRTMNRGSKGTPERSTSRASFSELAISLPNGVVRFRDMRAFLVFDFMRRCLVHRVRLGHTKERLIADGVIVAYNSVPCSPMPCVIQTFEGPLMHTTSTNLIESLKRPFTAGPMTEQEIAYLRDTQGFIEFAIRNGISFPMAVGAIAHDVNAILRGEQGVLPKVAGYAQTMRELESAQNDPELQRELSESD